MSDADQPTVSYMDSTNSRTATWTKDHPSAELRMAVDRNTSKSVGEVEPNSRGNPRFGEVGKHNPATESVLGQFCDPSSWMV